MPPNLLPYGYCLQWQTGLVTAHVVADALIALACFRISLSLRSFLRRRPDTRLPSIFIAFLLALGVTHILQIVTLWQPLFPLAEFFEIITAIASLATVIALHRLKPKFLKLSTSEPMQARFHQTFENAGVGLTHVDPSGRILLVNRELCRILGYTPDELQAMNTADLRHPDDPEDGPPFPHGRPAEDLETYTSQNVYRHKQGTAVFVQITASLVRDSSHQPSYFVVSLRDDTERRKKELLIKQTLDLLRHRDRQLTLLFEQGKIGDFTWNIQRNEVTAHPIVWAMYGYTEERGPQPAEWFAQRQHPKDLPAITAHLHEVLSDPSLQVDLEFRILLPDHSIRWIACRGSVTRDETGKPLQVHGLNFDITRRKLAEESVRESESRLRALTDVMPQLVWFNDAAGNVEFFNHRWYEYTGQKQNDSLNWGWQPAIHPDDLAGLLGRWTRALATGAPHEAEFRLRHHDGSYRWFLGRGMPLRDDQGNIQRWFGTCTDIEERKMSEARLLSFSQELEKRVRERTRNLSAANNELDTARARLQQAHNALELRVRQLDATNHELARKNEEVEAFVYIVSHDLRSPLVNIQGFAKELDLSCQELRENLAPLRPSALTHTRVQQIIKEEIPDSLRYISASTNKFQRLIEALLELSRYGRQTYRLEEIDLAGLAQATLDAMRRSIDESGVLVSLQPVPLAYGDATAIGQVLSNLIGNALKYRHPGRPGEIQIGGQTEDAMAHFWVRDNGAGLPESAKPRLFQVFQRFHPTLAPGEGMGLAVVKRIVERHGGRIWAESVEGAGTTFHFTLPFRKAPDNSPAESAVLVKKEKQL